jgi:hypothetical protein
MPRGSVEAGAGGGGDEPVGAVRVGSTGTGDDGAGVDVCATSSARGGRSGAVIDRHHATETTVTTVARKIRMTSERPRWRMGTDHVRPTYVRERFAAKDAVSFAPLWIPQRSCRVQRPV